MPDESAPSAGPPAAPRPDDAARLDDNVKQLGFFAALGSLGYVFWVVGGMEMIERLAYYGVKAVATLYAKAPASEGGLGVSLASFGVILGVWAATQSFLPVFTGGLSDRYGYKPTIFVSTGVKIVGYVTMAMFGSYWGFFAGAILLAVGTAIFKPGIQGTLINATRRENSSMAWGIFYQTVNIGGYIGPLVAGAMRKLEWRFVFIACALTICVNFLLLLTYKEPLPAGVSAEELAARRKALGGASLWRESVAELRRPHVWRYLLAFTGFWFMFNALFDVLPAHIDDWVDSRDLVLLFFGQGGADNWLTDFLIVLDPTRTRVQPEGMVNINPGLIMTTCFLFAFLSGKLRATTSIVLGSTLASLALIVCGYATVGAVTAVGILIFSVGEMLSSPKFSEYVGNFAPPDKKAMYIGFTQIPIGVGWTLEGFIGPWLYDALASKERFARELLVERGLSPVDVSRIPEGEAFQRPVSVTSVAPAALTAQLHASHDVGLVWVIMAVIGLASAVGIYWYGVWLRKLVSSGSKAT